MSGSSRFTADGGQGPEGQDLPKQHPPSKSFPSIAAESPMPSSNEHRALGVVSPQGPPPSSPQDTPSLQTRGNGIPDIRAVPAPPTRRAATPRTRHCTGGDQNGRAALAAPPDHDPRQPSAPDRKHLGPLATTRPLGYSLPKSPSTNSLPSYHETRTAQTRKPSLRRQRKSRQQPSAPPTAETCSG
jgi:hypothetical protein